MAALRREIRRCREWLWGRFAATKDHHQPEQRPDVRKQFADAGFEVVENKDDLKCFGVKKYNCLRHLRSNSDGIWMPSGPPLFIVRGLTCELEDRGYQKFWHCQGKRFPIQKTELNALHRFDEEVRGILGLKGLYHLALGTTSVRSVYDRLDGRPDK